MEVKKVYRESMPAVKLIGKRYTNADRDEKGTFGSHWQSWFEKGWFDSLKGCTAIPGVTGDYVGAMRMTGEGSFEYWIGVLFAPEAQAPEGFEAVDIPAGQLGVCWLYGDEKNGELYGPQASDLCMAAFAREGMQCSQTGWYLERYNSPRFTAPDEEGKVILDICAYLAE